MCSTGHGKSLICIIVYFIKLILKAFDVILKLAGVRPKVGVGIELHRGGNGQSKCPASSSALSYVTSSFPYSSSRGGAVKSGKD